jgi:DNA-binding MarR family transcriptional regulator
MTRAPLTDDPRTAESPSAESLSAESLSAKSPSAKSPSAKSLSEDLRFVLHRLFRQVRRESQDLGVSPGRLLLLAAIREKPGIGVAELAQLERLRGPTVSAHINALEALGLVKRSPPDPNDRRHVGLVVTRKGTTIIEAIKRSRADWLTRKLAQLPPAGRAAIRNAIAPLREIVR